MTIDERIERLTESRERLALDQQKTQVPVAEVVDSIKRLERIALAHPLDIDDLQRRLEELEQRRGLKKPH